MSSPTPAGLGDLGFPVTAVFPMSTSTARFYANISGTDTGTVATTSRTLDLARALHVGTTGGKPLDATVHTRRGVPPWKSLGVAMPLELTFNTSGRSLYVTVAHKSRAAASGAGSTWRTEKTDVFRFKMGTDTDAVFHTGLFSSCNLQAIQRFYKTNITFAFKLASSTAAKDTTTDQIHVVCNSPVWIASGGSMPQTSVPFKVS